MKIVTEEYINEADGLIYCSVCHMPRQKKIEYLGRSFLPRIPCKCESEAQQKEESSRKLREQQEEISRRKASSLQDKALFDYTFANDSGINPEMQKAHDYVNHWQEMKEKSIGLLLWGDVGTGKSFFAGCIANALLEQGISVLMTNFAKILNTLTGMHFDDRNAYINSLNQYSLLIIDDLGAERNSEFALEQIFNVIDSRLAREFVVGYRRSQSPCTHSSYCPTTK